MGSASIYAASHPLLADSIIFFTDSCNTLLIRRALCRFMPTSCRFMKLYAESCTLLAGSFTFMQVRVTALLIHGTTTLSRTLSLLVHYLLCLLKAPHSQIFFKKLISINYFFHLAKYNKGRTNEGGIYDGECSFSFRTINLPILY